MRSGGVGRAAERREANFGRFQADVRHRCAAGGWWVAGQHMQRFEGALDPAEEAELQRCEQGGAADEAREDDGQQVGEGGEEDADAAVPVGLLEVRLPLPYPADEASAQRLRIQASNILKQART